MSLETREISSLEIEKIINYFKSYKSIKAVPGMTLRSFLSLISQDGISILACSRLLSESKSIREKYPEWGDFFEIQDRLQRYASHDQLIKNPKEGLILEVREGLNELGTVAANEPMKKIGEQEGA